MSLRQIKALWTLGMALLRKILFLPFARSPGAGPWLERLRQERLAPTPSSAWQRYAPAGRCIGCGLCESIAIDGSTSPSTWVLAIGRRPEDAPLVQSEAGSLQRLAREIERVCPGRVGVEDLTAIVRDNARLLGSP